MFVERLLNQGNAPLLEQTVKFHAARHKLLAENIANVSTPGYRQKDVSVDSFRQMLRRRLEVKRTAPPGTVSFGDIGVNVQRASGGLLYHDGNDRSMEQLVTDAAKNAIFHNMMAELLRKQYGAIESALQERIA